MMERGVPKYSFFALLMFVLAFIVLSPVLQMFIRSIGTEILITAVFISSLYLMSKDHSVLIKGALFAIPALIFQWLAYFHYATLFACLQILFTSALFAYIIILLCREVYSFRHLSTDLIYGALLIYLILGLFFAQLFTGLELIHPGSFFLELPTASQGIDLFNTILQAFLYFSLVTLTTLGYGDIVPITAPAQTLSSLEAIMGQFYIAVLVASLIGLLLKNRPSKPGIDNTRN